MKPSLLIARAALARGPLIRHGQVWQFEGRRTFSFPTIARLIASGDATRHGDIVVRRIRRAYLRTAANLSHCRRGHELTEANCDRYGSDRSYLRRRCRACRGLREKERAKVRIRRKSI